MACDLFAVDSIFRVSAFQVLFRGRVQADCASLRISAEFPGGIRVGGLADVETGSAVTDRNWSVLVDLPGGVPTSWCKSASVDIGAVAYDSDGMQICESETQTKVLSCCPQVSSLGPQELACRIRPGTGGALDRDVRWKVKVDWAADTPAGTQVSVVVELASVDDPTYIESESVHPTFPATEATTPSFHLPSGSRWTGNLYIALPSYCSHKRGLPEYVVPVCDAPACPLPPAGDVFLTVRDGDNGVVPDPNDTGCVSGDFITITAQDWPGTLTWRAEVNSQTLVTTPTGSPREVRIDMPAGDDRVTVTAQIIVDAPSGCIHSRSVTAKRCDCIPAPSGYALQVFDGQGTEVVEGECINGALADVVAPAHEGPVIWELDGQPRDANAADPRRLHVELTDGSAHTVSATVGRDKCAIKVHRTIEPCQAGVPTWNGPFWPRIPWCLILMYGGLVCLLVGLLALTIGVAAIASVVCWFWVASLLIETVVGPVIVMVVWMILAIGGVVIGGFLIMLGIVLLVLWVLFCGGCDGLKSPVSFCEMLKLQLKFLQIVGLILAIIETIILGASFIGAVVCGVGAASIMAVIDVVMWLIDMGVLTFLILGVEYFGNAVGCFNTTPSSWPFSALQIRLPPPGSNNLPCLDADAQLK